MEWWGFKRRLIFSLETIKQFLSFSLFSLLTSFRLKCHDSSLIFPRSYSFFSSFFLLFFFFFYLDLHTTFRLFNSLCTCDRVSHYSSGVQSFFVLSLLYPYIAIYPPLPPSVVFSPYFLLSFVSFLSFFLHLVLFSHLHDTPFFFRSPIHLFVHTFNFIYQFTKAQYRNSFALTSAPNSCQLLKIYSLLSIFFLFLNKSSLEIP
ncbi:unnamed protein product [Acanthosepion pharaonis]|uniref:Uncharacterized protein n=1 Tax=Acanthosepion pharaonis TaxID=158019 RepID=A0A812D1D7_ACAPH|nr:unnamed protein product [Sepia pharaonis]